jgi:uncharacterized protein (TIGR02246 family)
VKRRVALMLTPTFVLGTLTLGKWDVHANETPGPTAGEEEADVRAVLAAQIAAWAAGDGTAFAATVTDDADLITFDGMHLQGRQAIATAMQHQFDTELAGTHVEAEPVRIRFLTDETVVMITEGGVVFPGEQTLPAERASIQTFVVARKDGGWLVEAFQNTRISPPSA